MCYTIYAISIIVILILGLIVKEDTLSQSVKIILCTIVGLIAYCALNRSSTERFAGRGKRNKKPKVNLMAEADKLISQKISENSSVLDSRLLDANEAKKIIDKKINNLIPRGTIVMWQGTIAPKGWQLCDGRAFKEEVEETDDDTGEKIIKEQDSNINTPNLSGKFVLGYDSIHSLGSSGGNKKINLLANQLPQHTHKGNYEQSISSSNQCSTGSYYSFQPHYSYQTSVTTTTECTDCSKFGTMPNSTTRGDLSKLKDDEKKSAISSGDDVNIMPPYYVLAYIIKV